MARRKIRDAADVEALRRGAAAAGVPLLQWARDRGVDGRSLHAWVLNSEGRRRTGPEREARKAGLVELVAVNDTPSRYVVRVGDFAIELDDAFREATLRRLLEVVLSC
jgi:hypothetical protein